MKSFTQRTIEKFREKYVSEWQVDDGADNPLWDTKYPTVKQIEAFITKALQDYVKEIEKELEGMKYDFVKKDGTKTFTNSKGSAETLEQFAYNEGVNDSITKLHQLTGEPK